MGLKMIHQIKLSMIIKNFKSNMSIKSINQSKMMLIIGILEI
jgi:hypothetical protein